ncbi:MAG: hypothetical protein CVT49_07965 [candidate division Zixibacteria bacterium HGW-Zixibacteria-1]|nr:MAG: hypothetical protein CVT49_07965 [candidate division Zixibacteria bacterium HGW-Zixibacteria-1]
MSNAKAGNNVLWLIYLSLALAGLILLGDALRIQILSKLTARLGIALIFSAIALIIAKDRPPGIIAIAITWMAVLITIFN